MAQRDDDSSAGYPLLDRPTGHPYTDPGDRTQRNPMCDAPLSTAPLPRVPTR